MERKVKVSKNRKVEIAIVVSLLFIGIVARMLFWPNGINQINCDEAMSAINAKAIAETGKDMYGISFPVYFETWQYGGQSAMLIYIMAICIKIFGFTIFSIRLPLLLASIFSLFLFYDLAKHLWKKKKIAWIALGLLAICPWHIMQSKWSIDCNLLPHFLLLSIWLLTKGVQEDKKWRYLLIDALLWIIDVYLWVSFI